MVKVLEVAGFYWTYTMDMHPIGYASRNCDMRAIYRIFVRPGTLVFTAQTCLEYSNPNKKIEKCSQDAISSLIFTSITC